MFKDPFDPKTLLRQRCGCGGDHAPADHARLSAVPASDEQRFSRVVDAAVLRAVFPVDAQRRLFLKKVGAATAMAAIASVFPLATAREAFAQGGAPEKKDLKVGFIPITCATPIIMAHPMGFYSKQGLNVEVVKTAGWAVIRDKSLAKEYDAAHMLSPMPLAISLGVGSNPVPWTMPAIENINGQAITLAIKHKDKRNPKDWKGFRFAVPFDYSMHNYLLRYYVAEHGLDPDKDISIRSVPPPEMVANLRADNIDGYLGPDPFNQRAVFDGIGFIHLLDQGAVGRPSVLRLHRQQGIRHPESQRLSRAPEVDHRGHGLCLQAGEPQGDRQGDRAHQLPEPARDGAGADPDRHLRRRPGRVKKDPNRIDFDPFPWNQFAIWIMTQMKRWGQLKGDVDYAKVAADVYLATDTANMMKEMGLTPPDPCEEDHRGHGQGLRSGQAQRVRRQLRHQAELSRGDAQELARPAGGFAVAADLRRHRGDLADRDHADGRHRARRWIRNMPSWSAPRRRPARSRRCRRPPTSAPPSGSTSPIPSTCAVRTTRASASSSPIRWAACCWASALAALFAVPLGFLIGMSPLVYRALDPFIQILKPVSPLAWMPLALYTIKDSAISSIFVIFICSVWPMLINTAFGVASVRREWLNVARTLEVGPFRTAFKVILPAAAPTIMTGMRISIGIAWLVIVAAEMLVGGTGIGYFVWNEWNNLSIANIVTAILLIGVVGLLLDQGLARLTKLVTYPE